MQSVGQIVKSVVESSDNYEKYNKKQKIEYIKRQIELFKSIVNQVNGNLGTFATGYPFYVINKNFEGNLFLIEEQFRYNNDLLESITIENIHLPWVCEGCLKENYDNMPDLKEKCIVCDKICNDLKPRKIINRLPDLDLWMVSEDNKILQSCDKLQLFCRQNNLISSDIDPIMTIKSFNEISKTLSSGYIPINNVPIDLHIISRSSFANLIACVPRTIADSIKQKRSPYLPIHPFSFRKEWQHDDVPYNFVFDYLFSLSEFNIDEDLQDLLDKTRYAVASTYSSEDLYKIMLSTAGNSTKRRCETPQIREVFEKKIESWVRVRR